MNDLSKFIDEITGIKHKLNNIQDVVGKEEKDELSDLLGEIIDKAEAFKNPDRRLKVGIVGTVKAGKSSFLNTLIFNGEDVLPKAATPMTAALTKIDYAKNQEEQKAIFHYYSSEEWRNIEEKAQIFEDNVEKGVATELEKLKKEKRPARYGMQGKPESEEAARKRLRREQESKQKEDLKAAHELVEMAKKNNLSRNMLEHDENNENRYTKSMEGVNNLAGFLSGLKDYVGADGKYTPMVSYLELRIHDDRLKDYAIVDTPGVNDPIASRVKVTTSFLKECDVALMLSRTSHFFDTPEKNLLTSQIKKSGVAKTALVGTMLDSYLLENEHPEMGLIKAWARQKYKTENRAKEELAKIEDLPSGLTRDHKPVITSSMLESIALKGGPNSSSLNKDEKFILGRLRETYDDFDKVMETINDYHDFAGFKNIHSRILKDIAVEKEQLLQNKIQETIKADRHELYKKVEGLIAEAKARMTALQEYNQNELKKRKEDLMNSLNKCGVETKIAFEDFAYDFSRGAEEIKIDIEESKSKFNKVDVTTKHETHKTETWLGFKKEYHNTTTEYASASDTGEKLERYGQACKRIIISGYAPLIDKRIIERKLREIIHNFASSKNLNLGSEFIGPIRRAVNNLSFAPLSYEFVDDIQNKFLSTHDDVQEGRSNIERMRRALNESLNAIKSQMLIRLDENARAIKDYLEEANKQFISDVEKEIMSKYDELIKDSGDIEDTLPKYEACIAKFKEVLSKLEDKKNGL